MPKRTIADVGKTDILVRNEISKSYFKKLKINPSRSYLMDVKKAIFKFYGLPRPIMTIANPRKTLAEQLPNNAYGVPITKDEKMLFVKLFNLSPNDYYSSISERIEKDVMSMKEVSIGEAYLKINSKKLKPGNIINNKDLMKYFKCSNSGGMRRSRITNTLVIVSDHTRGIYEDKWIEGKLHYTGMGLRGDQSLSFSQNKTLAESNKNGIDVHLFEVFDSGEYVYNGRVCLVDKPYQEKQKDEVGHLRNVWIFPLGLVDSKEPAIIPEEVIKGYQAEKERQARQLSDQELDERIKAKSGKAAKRKVVSNQYQGDPEIKEKAKRLAEGRCNLCGEEAPFLDREKKPYLEGHHIIWLSKGGPDVIGNVVALCPNCHRKMHILNLELDITNLKESVKNRD